MYIFFSGHRCGINHSHPNFFLLLNIYTGVYPWIDIFISIVTYISIIGKLLESRARLRMANASVNNEDVVKVQIVRFVVFITLLTFQWTPLSVYLLMGLFGAVPPLRLTFVTVIVSNLGGVFNGLAYSAFHVMKQKYFQSLMRTKLRSRTNSSATWSMQKSG